MNHLHTQNFKKISIEISEVHVTPINSILLLHLRLAFSSSLLENTIEFRNCLVSIFVKDSPSRHRPTTCYDARIKQLV